MNSSHNGSDWKTWIWQLAIGSYRILGVIIGLASIIMFFYQMKEPQKENKSNNKSNTESTQQVVQTSEIPAEQPHKKTTKYQVSEISTEQSHPKPVKHQVAEISTEQSHPKPVKHQVVETPIEQSDSKPARYHVGQVANICGKVFEVKSFKQGTYMDLGNYYPAQDITLTVWNENNLDNYVNKTVCVYGKVKLYNNQLTINVNDINKISIQ